MLAAVVIVLAVAAAYIDALGGPFLWDDRLLVLDVPIVEHGASLATYLRQPLWTGFGHQPLETAYYRPLVVLSFALDHRLHGSNPGGYHLTNLVLHALAALLLYALVKRSGVREHVAGLIACGWALLPRLAEAAGWISGRADVMAGALVFGALLLWGRGLLRCCLSAVLFGLALLAKESAIALLPAILVSEWLRAPGGAEGRTHALKRALPLFVVLAAYLGGRLSAVGYADQTPSLGAARRGITVLQAVGTYAGMLVDVYRPRAVIGRVGAFSVPAIALGALLLGAGGYALFRLRGRITPDVGRGLALALGALLPVVHLAPIPLRTLVADRFLYLPTAGLALAVAPALDRFLGAARTRLAALAAVVVSLGVTTFARVGVWSDETEFWTRTYLETAPTNNAAATELLGVYFRAGLFSDALELAERALRYDDPSRRDVRYNRALCLGRLGRREEAAALFESDRSASPSVAFELSMVEIQLGRFESARARLEQLARRGHRGARVLLPQLPAFAEARAELGRLGDAEPERRARLATYLGDDLTAKAAWKAVVRLPEASKAELDDALRYLVRTGELEGLRTAARKRLAQGPLDPETAAVIDVRLGELERLVDARQRLGLGVPASH